MQIDCEHRRPVEVESIPGEPVRRARRAGTLRQEFLYAIARRLDPFRCGIPARLSGLDGSVPPSASF